MQWLERMGLTARANDEVQKLSRGNQQRVQLVAALVYEPALLILDEPFAGLDPVAVDVMSEVLRERTRAGVSVIFSSHQLDIVEDLVDQVGIIQQGHMVAVGSVDELRSQGPRRYWIMGPTNGWAQALEGVKVVQQSGPQSLVELHDRLDDQTVLRAALAAGPVHEFRRDVPRLSELFRHVVAASARSQP
jgi:ABC-2 type transport system ATP-binding protein